MTLHSLPEDRPSGYITVTSDTFVWQSDKEYRFAGATLANGKWETNPISWHEYYIMTNDQGIGISLDDAEYKYALVEKGEETLVAYADRTKAEAAWRDLRLEFAKPNSLGEKSVGAHWHEIKAALKTAQPLESAQGILSAMEAWEKTSYLTLQWVENALRKRLTMYDTKEVFIAGHHWLWHNITQGVVIIGHGQNIWGNARLPFGEKAINHVALLPCGDWLVSVTSQEKYLLHWNGRDIEVRAFVFPHGPWKAHGKWRYWYIDRAILTPENRLVMIPSQSDWRLENTYLNWACFRDWFSEQHVLLIHYDGKLLDLDLSRRCIRDSMILRWFYPGEQHMLIFYLDDRNRMCISLVNISSVANAGQCPHLLWQVVVDPYNLVRLTPYPVHLKDENEAVEVFAFAFRRPHDRNHKICLVNERGEFWIPSLSLKNVSLDYYMSADGATGGDKPAIAVYATGPQEDPVWGTIRVSNGQGHMQLRSGITLSGPFIPLPKGKEGLWPYLASALGIEHTPKKK